MAVPKSKITKSKRNMRRAHDALAAHAYVEDKVTVVPEVSTYGQRSLGATTCPGILVDSFALTL